MTPLSRVASVGSPYRQVSSSVDAMLQASRRLPAELKALFDGLFMHGKSQAAVRAELGLSPEVFEQRRRELLRNLRAVAAR